MKDIVGESFIEDDADDQQKGDRNAMSDFKQKYTKIDTKFERLTETDSKETHTHTETHKQRQTPHAHTHLLRNILANSDVECIVRAKTLQLNLTGNGW